MTALPRLVAILLAVLLAFAGEAHADGELVGTVRGAQSREPVADVVVTATSTALEGERTVVTDARGRYRVPSLPHGVYTLRFEKELFRPDVRTDLILREGDTLRTDVDLFPELEEEAFVLYCGPAVVDVSSSTAWDSVNPEMAMLLPVSRPSGRNGAVRTADSLMEWVPGVTDSVSIHGASPYENEYLFSGLSTRDAVSGLNALPVSTELVSDDQVFTSGYLPEHGRATGGVVRVEGRLGSNQLHGSVFAHWAPGVLEGRRESVPGGGSLKHLGDFGATLGGPLLEDRLWFFAGVVPSLGREKHPARQDSSRTFFTDQRGVQAMGRLTYLINMDHHVSLSALAAPGSFRVAGAGAGRRELDSLATQVMLHHSGAAWDKKLLFDVRVGWLGQRASQFPVAGGDALGVLPAGAGAPGGLDGLSERAVDQLQASLRGLYLLNALGAHFIKAGVDAELAAYERTRTALESRTTGSVLGGYVQDSWTLASRVTVNAGLRYDVQRLDADGEGRSRATLPLLSPRVGVAVDLLRDGRAKVFAHYAKYPGLVPLGLLDGASEDGAAVMAPDLQPLSTRELSAGAEAETWAYTRVGATYVRRTLDSGLASIRGADGDGVLLVNPGSGPASHLPRAERTYDAVTLALSRAFFGDWLGHLSYTWSRLRGNQEGLGATPSGASGPLLADRPHVLRAYGARRLRLTRTLELTPSLAYLGGSGTRLDGPARTPWVHSLDVHLGATWRPVRDEEVSFSLDAFNIFNAQAATLLEERTTDEGTASVPVRYQPPRQVRFGVRYSF